MSKLKKGLFRLRKGLKDSLEQIAPGIFLARMPEGITLEQMSVAEHIVSPLCKAEIPTYVNVPWKSVFLALKRFAPDIVPNYFYSSPQVDRLCLGLYPDTVYLDIGRAGPFNTVKRSINYLELAQSKMINSSDKKTKEWVRVYGIGTAIPLTSRRRVFEWAIENNAKLYLVPATSVAEGTVIAYRQLYPRNAFESKDPWLKKNVDEKSFRDHASKRFYELFMNHNSNIKMVRLIKNQITFKKFAMQMMKIVEKHFCIYNPSRMGKISNNHLLHISHLWGNRLYNPEHQTSHPVFGAMADCSEIVVRSKSGLSPTPYSHILLFGDKLGTSTSQLISQAKLIKGAMPEIEVIILVNSKGKPLKLAGGNGVPIARPEDAFVISLIDALLRKQVVQEFYDDVYSITEGIKLNPAFK